MLIIAISIYYILLAHNTIRQAHSKRFTKLRFTTLRLIKTDTQGGNFR